MTKEDGSDKHTCSLEMANGLEADMKYPQKFVYPQAKNMPPMATNEKAKHVDQSKVMNQVLHAK